MFFIQCIRYLKGYVLFEVSDGFIERFINLCASARINIWGGRLKQGCYQAYVPAGDYKRLRELARKSSCHLQCVEKHGFPFQRFRYRHRWGLVFGILLFLAFLIFMSGFIWRIEVSGNETISEQRVLDELSLLGLGIGSWRGNLDARDLERRMMLEIEEIGWIAVNIRGSSVEVEIDERTMPPEELDFDTPTNIVASRSGQITYMEVYEGMQVVQVGDTVLAGDIIVSGVVDGIRGTVRVTHARAVIMAEFEELLVSRIPLEQAVPVATGERESRSWVRLFSWEIPLFIGLDFEGSYREEVTEEDIYILFFKLPVTMVKRDYEFYEEEQVTYTAEEAQGLAEEALTEMEAETFEGCTIRQRELEGSVQHGEFVLSGRYLLEQDIGVEVEIIMEEYDELLVFEQQNIQQENPIPPKNQ